MAVHADRDHATWSASATDRNVNCEGALAMTAGLLERTSEAADWGTACHQVSEKCLRSGKDAVDFIGTTEKGKKYSFEVDDEMAETAQMYVDFVRSLGGALQIEQKFSLASLKPPFDAGGTGDAVVYLADERTLHVVDLKGGRGVVVEAKGNPQLRTYGLGALLANPGLDVEVVRVTIVQPRAGHKDGRIRSETIDVIELLEWTQDLVAAMHRSKKAIDDKGEMPEAAWASTYLRPGGHCKFCGAAGFCPALAQRATDAAGVWFDDLDQPNVSNAPAAMSPEAMSKTLDLLDMIEDWIKAVRAHAHSEAENGTAIPNYILVDKTGREKWLDDAAAEKAGVAAIAAGLPQDKAFNAPKLRTPKQVRDALKKAKLDVSVVAGLSGTETTGTNLVRETKTSRPAVAPAVEKHFDILD